MARPGSPPVHTRPGAPPARSQHVMPNAAHVSRAPERHSAPPASAAVVPEMIRPTVPSSQRCHLKLKIHVKSRDATFKQAVEASSGFTIQVSRNPFRASWPPGGTACGRREPVTGHRRRLCEASRPGGTTPRTGNRTQQKPALPPGWRPRAPRRRAGRAVFF